MPRRVAFGNRHLPRMNGIHGQKPSHGERDPHVRGLALSTRCWRCHRWSQHQTGEIRATGNRKQGLRRGPTRKPWVPNRGQKTVGNAGKRPQPGDERELELCGRRRDGSWARPLRGPGGTTGLPNKQKDAFCGLSAPLIPSNGRRLSGHDGRVATKYPRKNRRQTGHVTERPPWREWITPRWACEKRILGPTEESEVTSQHSLVPKGWWS